MIRQEGLSSGKPGTGTATSTGSRRLAIRTYHCKFCKQLLLATTRAIDSLPRRREPALDRAMILPLQGREEKDGLGDEEDEEEDDEEEEEDDDEEEADEKEKEDGDAKVEEGSLPPARRTEDGTAQPDSKPRRRQSHYTILLSTTIPERNAVVIRRGDGFERRILLRCGRCRVLVGYVLDDMLSQRLEGDDTLRLAKEISAAQFAYILPDALVETGGLDGKEPEPAEMESGGWEHLGKTVEQ